MQKVNIYDLLSEAIENGIGNTSSQKDNVSALFIEGLFDKSGEMEFETVDGKNGIEYHASFDGYKGTGKTPALALKNLLQEVIEGLHFAEMAFRHMCFSQFY